MEILAIIFVVVFGPAIIDIPEKLQKPADEHIAHWEGYRDTAYQDVAGVWTIGYGQITIDGHPVVEGDTTTEVEAREWLIDRIEDDVEFIKNYAERKGYKWDDHQVAALASFIYNLGQGRLNTLTRGGLRSNEQIADAILLYNKAGGKVWQGLINRREYERNLFMTNM